MRKPTQSTCKNKSNTNPNSNNGEKLRKGLWSPEEDEKLVSYMTENGVGCWSDVARNAGLQRCGKSCRLRWINYLRPDLKRGAFSPQEEDLIVHLHSLIGNRWSQIAANLPGRTDNEIKNFWNSAINKRLKKSLSSPNMVSPSLETPKDDNQDLGNGHTMTTTQQHVIMGKLVELSSSSSRWVDLSSSSSMSYSIMHRPMDPLYNPYPNPSHTLCYFPSNGLYFNVQADNAQDRGINTYNDINLGMSGDGPSHVFSVSPFDHSTYMVEETFEIEKPGKNRSDGNNYNVVHNTGEIANYQCDNNINNIKVENEDVGKFGGYLEGDEWDVEELMKDSSSFPFLDFQVE